MKNYILSIDQGTTGSRAFIFNDKGQVLSSAYQEFKQYYPNPGWVEHDANEIWQSVNFVIAQAIRKSKISSEQIKAIGITNQRETTVLWDRMTGKPVTRAIVWQDRRTTDFCQSKMLTKHKNYIQQKTGLLIDPYFSATKIKWLLDNIKGVRRRAQQGNICFGTIDTWLIYQLTGKAVHATDYTNASRTMLFDIHKKVWDQKLLDIFNIPHSILPQVNASGSIFGHTENLAGLKQGTPIMAVMGDQQAALYGQGCTKAGMMKNTYGTGCFMLLNTGKKKLISTHGLLTTLACDKEGSPVYALEGAVFMAGAVIQWLRDELKLIKSSADSETMIQGVKDTQGAYIVPAFAGLGAPYWRPDARGTITGLTRGVNAKHIVRAALESIAYQTKDIVDLMKREAGLRILSLNVDGGACKNNFLMQFQADVLSTRVIRPRMVDSTVAGAAYLAGKILGIWNEKQINSMRGVDKIFYPNMPQQQVHEKYLGWQKAVRQTLESH